MAHCHRKAGAVCSGSSTQGYGRLQRICARGSPHCANSAFRHSGNPALVSPAVLAAEYTRHAWPQRCRARHSVAAAFALADRAQVSSAERQQTGAADASQLSHLEGLLRVIGVGPRGAAAVERLLGDGRLHGADLWVVDENRRAMPGATCVTLQPDRAPNRPPCGSSVCSCALASPLSVLCYHLHDHACCARPEARDNGPSSLCMT